MTTANQPQPGLVPNPAHALTLEQVSAWHAHDRTLRALDPQIRELGRMVADYRERATDAQARAVVEAAHVPADFMASFQDARMADVQRQASLDLAYLEAAAQRLLDAIVKARATR